MIVVAAFVNASAANLEPFFLSSNGVEDVLSGTSQVYFAYVGIAHMTHTAEEVWAGGGAVHEYQPAV